MYCTQCGSAQCSACAVPHPRVCTCAACLTAVPAAWAGHAPLYVCPRCAYTGAGAGYFSRGRNVAKVVGIGFVTSGILGLGGLAYYLIRRHDLLCPCCGRKWGAHGERALAVGPSRPLPLDGDVAPDELLGETAQPGIVAGGGFFVFAVLMLAAGLMSMHTAPFILAALAAAAGFHAHRRELGRREARRAALLAALQPAVLALARRSGGRLTVTDVSAALRWPLPRARKVLHSLDDGVRVDSVVSSDGVIVYEFREVLHAALAPRPRGAAASSGVSPA